MASIASPAFVLASKSAIRAALLRAAGLAVEIRPADISERSLEQGWSGAPPEAVAQNLAVAKAVAMSQAMPDRIVIGADQTMALGPERFSKAGSIIEARE